VCNSFRDEISCLGNKELNLVGRSNLCARAKYGAHPTLVDTHRLTDLLRNQVIHERLRIM
jgi:hypothetical protein